ncbi:hypothetical protein BJ684DRAFT_14814 [Piptocephalis cylindrospora]|uniref:RRM domain-containing protein n=1 Tax=Piptocephalis cylindrospora TaxID=1907219 RepID=A0A4P9Y6Z7_9FUNG|nr:hypothetical protein BJ684DRAFT_14814 [Piptocephalis cylindrospora]|eukprot:RKP14886.1 hypothetical protein BJ684DRAFT_14814 [Piptocephalis cylindrospora]
MAAADDDFDIYDSDLLALASTVHDKSRAREDNGSQQSSNNDTTSKDSTVGGGTTEKGRDEGMGDDDVFAEFAEYNQVSNGSATEGDRLSMQHQKQGPSVGSSRATKVQKGSAWAFYSLCLWKGAVGSKDGSSGSGVEGKVIPLDPGATVALTVTELQWWTTEGDLREMAKEVGQDQAIKELAFSEHKGNGKSRGYESSAFFSLKDVLNTQAFQPLHRIAFMLFSSAASAQAVKRHLETKTIGEKPVQAIFTHQTTNPYKTGPKDTKKSYQQHGGGGDGMNGPSGMGGPSAPGAHIMRYPGLPFQAPPPMGFPMGPGAMPQQQPPMHWRGGHMSRGGRGGFRGGGRGGMGQPAPPYGALAGAAFNPAFFDPTSAAAMAGVGGGGANGGGGGGGGGSGGFQGYPHNNQGRNFHGRGGGGGGGNSRGGGPRHHHQGQGMGQRHSEEG